MMIKRDGKRFANYMINCLLTINHCYRLVYPNKEENYFPTIKELYDFQVKEENILCDGRVYLAFQDEDSTARTLEEAMLKKILGFNVFHMIKRSEWKKIRKDKNLIFSMKTVKTWSRDNDRYEVAMHTVGSGLSYAELDEDKLPQTAVIEELNRVENEELRRGYYLGIINQRGVHWIDPEGKPELELAEDYENRANIAESRGYSRYAGILRVIGDEFKREAKSNILEAKNGDDE